MNDDLLNVAIALSWAKMHKDARVVRQAASRLEALEAENAKLREESNRRAKCINFFASVIRSGESFTATCQRAMDEALGAKHD